ncbi:MAG: PEGA domain-containing protein, partial [Lachnospiraceae bacterium]|nr:PEGA domain-containing protein [Lachnospiraceae bacterium]
YAGTTVITDKFGQALAIAQIQVGDIVDVCFMKDDKLLVKLQLSPEAFAYRNVTKYSLDGQRGSAVIGDESYRLLRSALILSEGRKIEAADIINRDVVTIRGIGRDVLSVIVEQGHGYLRLAGDAYAIGGWIEVGQSIIQKITDDMLLVVPEGTVDIYISNRGFSATRQVKVERNKETVLDLSDEKVEEIRKGKVVFTITPATASVYVGGEEVDTSKVVELEFGLHQIVCEASGYDTVTQYIKVTEDIASITITMDKAGTNTGSGEDVSGNSLTPSGGGRVYVDFPAGVELYVDGVYIGLTPAHFAKKPGNHTITLRLQGFITKSYTVYVDEEPTDLTYSFTALEPDLLNGEGGVSGNN